MTNYLLDHTLGGKAEECVKQVVQEQLALSHTTANRMSELSAEIDSQDLITVFQALSNIFAGEPNPKQLFQKAVNLRNNTMIFRTCERIQKMLCQYIDWKSKHSDGELWPSSGDVEVEKLFQTFETDPFWVQEISKAKTAPGKTVIYDWIAKRLKEAERLAAEDNHATLTPITGHQLYNRFRKFAFSQVLEEEFCSDGIWLLFAAKGVDPLWKMSAWSEHGGDRVLMLRHAVKCFLEVFPSSKEVVKNTEEMLTKEIGLEGTAKPLFRRSGWVNPSYWDGFDFSRKAHLPKQIWDRLRTPLPS